MLAFLPLILVLLPLVPSISAIPSLTQYIRTDNFTWLSPSDSTIQQELGRHLSKNASIYFPGSPTFLNDTQKWAANTESNFSAVVVPATDRDVAATVS